MPPAVRIGTRGRRARGTIVRQSLDGGPVEEQDTQACRHCQSQLIVQTTSASKAAVLGGLPVGGYCSHCDSVLCESCARLQVNARNAREACRPYAEVIEESFRRQALRQACGS